LKSKRRSDHGRSHRELILNWFRARGQLWAGAVKQVTVPVDLAATVKLWIDNYRRYWQAIEKISVINRRLLQLRQIPAAQGSRGHGASAEPGRGTRR